MVKRYKAANRQQKSEILDELCAVSGYHKKHAIRLLNKRKIRRPRGKEKRGRPEKYPTKMCLPLWLPHYSKTYGQLDSAVYQGLLVMSASAIDRLLASSRVICKRGIS